MSEQQPGILADVPLASRYLFLRPRPHADLRPTLRALAGVPIDESLVVGVGSPTTTTLGVEIDGLRPHPVLVGPAGVAPSTQAGLWLWLRGDDRGVLLHRSRELVADLADGFALDEVIDGFRHREGRDLSGYVDGTENPKGAAASAAAFDSSNASFVAVQRWIHDLSSLDAMSPAERDDCVGRRLSDNEEFASAPTSAHVKRAAQESFEPEAFVVRRSMAWTEPEREGLVFVAFGHSLDAYETILRRMLGLEDGIADGLFRFTRPVSGSYLYCPPVRNGHLDLSALAH